MDGTVRGAVEVIDIRLGDGWPGQTHKRASAKADGWEVRGRELEVCLHRTGRVSEGFRGGGARNLPILVASAHSAELELEAIFRHHVLLCMRIVGAVDARRLRLGRRRGRRRRHWCRGGLLLLLPRAQSWVGRHGVCVCVCAGVGVEVGLCRIFIER